MLLESLNTFLTFEHEFGTAKSFQTRFQFKIPFTFTFLICNPDHLLIIIYCWHFSRICAGVYINVLNVWRSGTLISPTEHLKGNLCSLLHLNWLARRDDKRYWEKEKGAEERDGERRERQSALKCYHFLCWIFIVNSLKF